MSDRHSSPSSAPTAPAPSTYRSFLFADLRGYTGFIERAGNAAAAELLDAYSTIVRDCVRAHHGAEIKVEGDGFHVVFPSASSAVMCGLAIVGAAERASAERPDRPIKVGVGIHAGEAIETPDGFVGSAVNIAARACSAAAGGQVLVTGTVRGIVRASVPVEFVSMGHQRLKGVSERIELFAAVPHGTAPPRRRPSRRWVAGAAAALVAALAVVGIGLAGALRAPDGSLGPSPAASRSDPAAAQLNIGAVELGRYVADQFHPPFTFLVDDPGWLAYRHSRDAVGLRRDESPLGTLDVATVEAVFTEPCVPDGPTIATGATPGDLFAALRGVPFLELGEDAPLAIGDFTGRAVEIRVSEGALAACASFGANEVDILSAGDENWGATPGEHFALRAVETGGTTVSFILSGEDPQSSVIANEEFFEIADRVLQSIDF